MATGVNSWSQTAASNATADSAVNWAEGMAPSAVNDSGRAMMASVAKFRDDIAGAIVTGGTSTAYTVTSNQTLTLAAGTIVAFTPHATNGATVTLNVDGLGAKPLRSAPGSSAELFAGVLILGTPYVATYFTSNSGEWILHGFYGDPYGVPLGGMMPYLGTSAPNSAFVLPYGQAISRTTYATLFSLVSTNYGVGDGSTTFNVPDLRGRVVAGKDDMGGSSANRLTGLTNGVNGDTLGATGGLESTTLAQANLPSVTLTTTIAAGQGSHNHSNSYIGVGTTAAGGGQNGPINTGVVSTETLPAMTGTTPLGGSGTAINNIQPTIIIPYILRVL